MTATPMESVKDRAATAISRLWWLVLLRGIVLVILGGYALAKPGMTLVGFTHVLGIFVLIDGVLAIIAGVLGWTESRGWTIVRGALGIIIGGFVLGHSVVVGAITATIIVLIIAFQSIFSGVLEIVVAIKERKQIDGAGWLIFSGVLSVIFGMLLLTAPLASTLVLIRILGVFAILFGIALVSNSFRLRKLGEKLDS